MYRTPLWKNARKRTRQYIRRAGVPMKVSAFMALDVYAQAEALRQAIENK